MCVHISNRYFLITSRVINISLSTFATRVIIPTLKGPNSKPTDNPCSLLNYYKIHLGKKKQFLCPEQHSNRIIPADTPCNSPYFCSQLVCGTEAGEGVGRWRGAEWAWRETEEARGAPGHQSGPQWDKSTSSSVFFCGTVTTRSH